MNDTNKDSVCNLAALLIDATVTYCSLNGPNSSRRRLSTTQLYMGALLQGSDLNRDHYEIFMQHDDLPEGVVIEDVVITDGHVGKLRKILNVPKMFESTLANEKPRMRVIL